MSEWISSKIEHLQKAILYFKGPDSYFGPSTPFPIQTQFKDRTTDYPIEFASLIDGIHFRNFDDDGVPIQFVDGKTTYSFSMIISYGLGELQNYLRTGNISNLQHVESQVNYVQEHTENHEHGFLLRAFDVTTNRHSGILSAMDQGQAVSLMVRYAQVVGDDKLLANLENYFRPFRFGWDNEGVAFELENGAIWFEEYPRVPLRHTLNGALFALIGLKDLAFHDDQVRSLFEKGIEGLACLLPKFDTGYWSYYHVDAVGAGAYIASMKYHALHVLQLKILSDASGSDTVAEFYNRFDDYQTKGLNRFRAAANITRRKLLNDYR